MAIEDGYVLAKSLQAHGQDVAVRAARLRGRTPAAHQPRAARIARAGRTYHLPSPLAQFKRDLVYRLQAMINPHASGIKANWVYEYDATAFAPGDRTQARA